MAAGQRMVYPAETVFSAPYVTHITVRVEHPRPVSLVCAAVKPLTLFVLYALPARAGHPQCELRVAGEQGEVTPSSVLVQLRKLIAGSISTPTPSTS
jgi:hypothetical protein